MDSEYNDMEMNTGSSEDLFADSQENKTACGPQNIELGAHSFKQGSSSENGESWRGTHISKLKRNTTKDQFPPVSVNPHHSVLFKLPVRSGEIPQPWPHTAVDVWDQHHVRLPHSPSSLYPVTESELQPRWELVRQALAADIGSSLELEAAILRYNYKYSDRWHFTALHSFFSEVLEDFEAEYFFESLLPRVVELALSLPALITQGIPLLRQHRTRSLSLTQHQVSSLLANAFLCTFPRRNTSRRNAEYRTFPDINFNRLFNGDGAESNGRMSCIHEKLKCLINYFKRVTDKMPEGVVTFSRHHVPRDRLPSWCDETTRLSSVHVSSAGTIEDDTSGMLQVDFANKMVGGGVLASGCVQEEIRFVICPELILSRLFTEALDDTEALVVTGCERFSSYSGYAADFQWTGSHVDNTPRDKCGRRYCTVVAIDAFHFSNAKTQYSAENINRELNKAYAGFSWGVTAGSDESVATGNWGCGAFRGDPCLKTLIQLMAAAKAGRDVAYFTFGDNELRDRLADMHTFLIKQGVTVGELWRVITSYNPARDRHRLYDHIYQTVINRAGAVSTPLKTLSALVPKKQKFGHFQVEKVKKESKNGHSLDEEEIEKVLGTTEDVEEEEKKEKNKKGEEEKETVKNKEARSLSLDKDKELCTKRLSSSWSNLNHSKRDFVSSASASEAIGGEHSRMPRKKKISDYFQPSSKS